MFLKEKIRCRCLRLTLLPYRVPAAFPHRPWVDTSYNAVIQKSCYRASGNEIQWVQLQSYFPECHQYTLFFLRFVLTQWIIIAPLKTCASQKAPGSHIPRYVSAIIHRSFPSAGQTHGAGTPKHIHTLVHACMHAATCWHWDLSVRMTQRSVWWFYAIRRVLMYFEEPKRAAYIERIPTGLTHWLVADGEDSHLSDNLLCWNDIGNTRHPTWIHFTYSNVALG